MNHIETAKMSQRGQIIIPRKIRYFINAKENTLFTFMTLDDETVVMKKLDKQKIIKEFQILRNSIQDKLTSEEINNEIQQYRKLKKR